LASVSQTAPSSLALFERYGNDLSRGRSIEGEDLIGDTLGARYTKTPASRRAR
jgi:hypothetical protein